MPEQTATEEIGRNEDGTAEPQADGGDLEPLNDFDSPCPDDPSPANDPNRIYSLPGNQIEPEAGYWTIGPRPLPRGVPVAEVLPLTSAQGGPYYVPPYPRDRAILDWEIAELAYLQQRRDSAGSVGGSSESDPGNYPRPPAALLALFGYPDTPQGREAFTRRELISDFIQLDKPPFGAIFNIGTRPQIRIENINQQHLLREEVRNGARPEVVRTGRQLARMFEEETPGLLHRHALNYLLYKRREISPPRQARIWMALDVAIYSALAAAWYFKWAASRQTHSYRQRPYEYDQNRNFRVLYDNAVGDKGVGNKCPRPGPCPSPGTPRHPAYPSGHSTYSAAASEILAYFFPDERAQFEMLANNIGTARLWAGVHWRSDHIAGQRVGRAVARRVMEQLQGDCVPRFNEPVPNADPNLPPPQDVLEREATRRRNQGRCDPDQDRLPAQRRDPFDDCGDTRSAF